MILIVDDDRQMRYILYHMLKNAGYNCLVSGSGHDALAYLENNPVELVIADIMMPEMNGVVLLEQIKKRSNTDVILITAYTRDYPTHEMIDRGADDFIQKPISGSELILRVKRVLKTRALLEERNRAEAEIRAKEAQLRALAARTGDVEEEMRRNFAMELHDRIGQNLTALNINLSLLKSVLPENSDPRNTRIIEDSQNLIMETAEHTRDIMGRLRPAALDDYGLTGAIKVYAKAFTERTGIRVDLNMEKYLNRLPVIDEMILFRVSQEIFTNIAKHSKASLVSVFLEETPGRVHYSIADNGNGFDPEILSNPSIKAGYGIATIRERLRLKNADFKLDSKPGKGAVVEIDYYR
ncbi:MAG: response regulator [Desulfobacteraceae bacterium]|nr:response regulator [Desulfobacteraceae bacterium]MBU4001823.1 response regulator [Pseudomonadota bacterium]MBU4055750.1 response regulator [Pseudomonadota bacterium]